MKTDAPLNPITVEVIGSLFAAVTEEMGEALIRASVSPNIKERRDCSTALLDADGALLAQAEHIPMHLGSFLDFVPEVLKRYSLIDIEPGDVFIGNDPYAGGGTHLPDIVMVMPIFAESRVVAWAINTAHHADFADRGHHNIYEEGPRIPPVRMQRADSVNREFMDFFLLNCQVPDERTSDLAAQMASCQLGVRRVSALCEKYGTDTVLRVVHALQDYSELRMRKGISAIPDGVYSFTDSFDTLTFAQALEISVRLEVRGDEVLLDFQAPPQVRAGINMIRTALLATVLYAVKSVVDPNVPPNAGIARAITVNAPLGSILNCTHPAPVFNRTSLCQRVVDVIHGAFAQAVPEKLTGACSSSIVIAQFNGVKPTGESWVFMDAIGGGFGARAERDGIDGVQIHMTNSSNLPCESLEREYPLTLVNYALVDGSGGVGRQTGGRGILRAYRAEAPCQIEVDGSRIGTRPWGLAGGGAGTGFRYSVNGVDFPFAGGVGALEPGDIIEIVTPGGGGYGAVTAAPESASAGLSKVTSS
ncbi:MAG: hydantoinase B/oxoprolinase family protein [Pseudomonadota bacterium]|nr:hydantoinase B/oxoprolinase family protein [Pseudomonadota bacterium]